MNEHEREMLWMAYLDGQLSAAEASRLDASLSPEERERLAAELRLEGALAEALRGDAKCPEAAWKRTQLEVRNQAPGWRPRLTWRRAALGAASMAAALVMVFAYVANIGPRQEPVFAISDNVEEFAGQAATRGCYNAVGDYLRGHGVDLRVKDLPRGTHHIRLIGAGKEDCQGHEVTQLLFECCGFPAKVIIVEGDSPVAAHVRQALTDGRVQAAREVGGYLAGVVSQHRAEGLLELLEEGGCRIALRLESPRVGRTPLAGARVS